MKKILHIAFALLLSSAALLADNEPKLAQNYPNPAKSKTYVKVDFTSPQATLTLSNILGETIYVKVLPHSGTFEIDVTEMAEGLYFYTLAADGHKVTKKLTVKK